LSPGNWKRRHLTIVGLIKRAPVMMRPLDEGNFVAKIVITHLKPTDARGRT
jgi:hypothetical protein